MPIETTDLRKFATAAACENADEVALRAAVSRAYYACFHDTLPFAEMLPSSAKERPAAPHVTHEELYNRVLEWRTGSICPALGKMTATRQQLSRAIDAARMHRVRADYHLDERITLKQAQMQIERARLVSRHTKLIFAEINRAGSASTDSEAESA